MCCNEERGIHCNNLHLFRKKKWAATLLQPILLLTVLWNLFVIHDWQESQIENILSTLQRKLPTNQTISVRAPFIVPRRERYIFLWLHHIFILYAWLVCFVCFCIERNDTFSLIDALNIYCMVTCLWYVTRVNSNIGSVSVCQYNVSNTHYYFLVCR